MALSYYLSVVLEKIFLNATSQSYLYTEKCVQKQLLQDYAIGKKKDFDSSDPNNNFNILEFFHIHI